MQDDLQYIARIVSGNLTLDEKRRLLPLLHKPAAHHKPIFREDDGSEPAYLAGKYSRE